jgi:VanZ family protein
VRRLLGLALAVYLAALVFLTLGPRSTPSTAVEKTASQVDRATQAGGTDPRPTTSPRGGTALALNVALFVPLGCLLLWLWPSSRWWAVVAAGATLSAAIELSQRWVFTWRGAQLSDVITNSLGTALGWALAAAIGHGHVKHLLRDRRWRLG